jgi:spore coat polysaccharide biosynthesis protein SpsF
MIQQFLTSGADYLSNCAPPTFPDGLDAEIMTFDALKKAWELAYLPSEREHVTPFIRHAVSQFRIENFEHNTDLSHLRWTVDEEQDLKFVRTVYDELFYSKPEFNWRDVLDLLHQKPQIANINAGIGRNEGSLKSQIADGAFLRRSENKN